MKFKHSLLVVIVATLLLALYAYLIGMAKDVAIASATMWIAGSIVTLTLNDLVFKWTTEREKAVTWAYCIGTVIALLSVLVFLWASRSEVLFENLFRLALAVFSAFLGGIWFYGPYKHLLLSTKGKEDKRWGRVCKKVDKAKTQEEKAKIINETLRYYLTGSFVDRSLDINKPLIEVEGKNLTVSELEYLLTDDPESSINRLFDRASAYTAKLVEEV